MMEDQGFTVDGGEWWHFDFKDWPEYSIGNAVFEQIDDRPAGVVPGEEVRRD